MRYSVNYKEFEQKALKQKDNWWCTNVLRKISTRISWMIVNIWPNITPNQLTVVGGSIGVVGALLLAIPSQLALVVGSLILLLWTVLDALDGEIARFTGKSSITGAFLDNVFDHVILALIFASLTIHLTLMQSSTCLIILGIGATIFFALGRLSVGLRSENLLKADIRLSMLGGKPKDEIQNFRREFSSPLALMGLFIVDSYDLVIRNYNIVHMVLIFSVINAVWSPLTVNSSDIPYFAVPIILYSVLMPLYFIALVVGLYMELNLTERKMRVEE
jgi:phosphatidylglycerophosphate synthase